MFACRQCLQALSVFLKTGSKACNKINQFSLQKARVYLRDYDTIFPPIS